MHASPAAKQPMAIIVPHEAHFHIAKGLDSTSSVGNLCLNPAIQEVVLKDANAVGKKNVFKANELLQAVVLTPDGCMRPGW